MSFQYKPVHAQVFLEQTFEILLHISVSIHCRTFLDSRIMSFAHVSQSLLSCCTSVAWEMRNFRQVVGRGRGEMSGQRSFGKRCFIVCCLSDV